MSLTIITTPPSYSSAHGDLIWVLLQDGLLSSPGTYTNYKYIAYVYVGSSTTEVARIAAVPQPVTKFGVFNLGDVIRNYVASVFNPVANSIVAQQSGVNQFFTNITVKFTQEYAGSETTGVNDAQRTYFNHYNGRMAGVTTSLAAFTNKVATNRPLLNYINNGDAFCLLPYFPASSSAYNFAAVAFSGLTQVRQFLTNFTPSGANVLQVLNVSPPSLNTFYAAPFIDDSITHYTVQVNSGAIYTFKLTCEAVYNNYTLHFLNQYGGFDSRNFTKVSRIARPALQMR